MSAPAPGPACDDAALLALSRRVGRALAAREWMLASAESCTGGWVAQVVTAVAGSSDWFDRAFVTYSNQAKREMLGVAAATLDQYGAVSEPTAREMAVGALSLSHAEVVVSITGVAGPGGGSPGKPVGTVVFGWATRDGRERCVTRHFDGDRDSVRRQSVREALEGVLGLCGAD